MREFVTAIFAVLVVALGLVVVSAPAILCAIGHSMTQAQFVLAMVLGGMISLGGIAMAEACFPYATTSKEDSAS